MFPDLPTTNACVWWQNSTLKWCMALASANSWTEVRTDYRDAADAQYDALDAYEQVRFFDGLPDDLPINYWD